MDNPEVPEKVEIPDGTLGRIDATEVNQYIPKFDLDEVVNIGGQRLVVFAMTKAGMVLDRVTRRAAFWQNRLFEIKGYFFRVLVCEGTRVSLLPHGRTKAGVKVRWEGGQRIAYENVIEEKKHGG